MPPIRFFCNRCNLMIKIGAQMAGYAVVCPQCSAKIQVPLQSDPQAEALYRFLQKKRAQEKAEKILGPSAPAPKEQVPSDIPPVVQATAPSPLPPAPTLSQTATPQTTVPQTASQTAGEDGDDSLEELEELEPDEVDDWIEQFWATVPETEDANTHRPQPRKPALLDEPTENPAAETEVAYTVTRYQQTVLLFRLWLLIVFLIGLITGIYLHSVYADWRLGRQTGKAVTATNDADCIVTGNLHYPDFDGQPAPDADAVVIVLPLDSVPRITIPIEGLRPNDDEFDPNGDGVQQITEIGGAFQRTGAAGEFSLPLPKSGKYFVLMISSHAKRAEGQAIDPATLQELRRFFRNPGMLIGEYGFVLEKYDFDRGQYVLKETLRP